MLSTVPATLTFHEGPFTGKETADLNLINECASPLVFAFDQVKLASVAPTYTVQPDIGIIPGGSSTIVRVKKLSKLGDPAGTVAVKMFEVLSALLSPADCNAKPGDAWARVASGKDLSRDIVKVRIVRGLTWRDFTSDAEAGLMQRTSVYAVDPEIHPFGGSYGSVRKAYWGYHCDDRVQIQDVAVKTICDREGAKRTLKYFSKELHVATLRHKYIASILGFSSANGHTIISPWYSNGEIPKYVVRIEASKEIRLQLITQVAEGLHFLQQHDIIHGDLKGNNVLVDGDGQAIIIDFGLSKLVDPNGQLTSTGGKGNARWQAPELCRLGQPKTFATDVYAFGCVALEIATGQWPLRRYTLGEIERRVPGDAMSGPEDYEQLHETSPLWNLMFECWNQIPEGRPGIGAVIERLQTSVLKNDEEWGVARSNVAA